MRQSRGRRVCTHTRTGQSVEGDQGQDAKTSRRGAGALHTFFREEAIYLLLRPVFHSRTSLSQRARLGRSMDTDSDPPTDVWSRQPASGAPGRGPVVEGRGAAASPGVRKDVRRRQVQVQQTEDTMRYSMRCGVIAFVLLQACEPITDLGEGGQRHRHPESPFPLFITTDRDSYEVELGEIVVAGETIWYVQFDIRLTYTNRSAQPIYIAAYPPERSSPLPPEIQHLEDGHWRTVYSPAVVLVRGHPFRVGPGDSFTYEYRVTGYDPQSQIRVAPTWGSGEIEGTYRVHFLPGAVSTGPDLWSESAPLEQRISNTFRLLGRLP